MHQEEDSETDDKSSSNKSTPSRHAAQLEDTGRSGKMAEMMETASEEEKALLVLYNNPAANKRSPSSVLSLRPDGCNKLIERDLFSLGYTASNGSWPDLQNPPLLADKPKLYEMLIELVQKRLKPNAMVIIGDYTQSVHLMVLQSFSRMFRDLGNEISVELPIEQVTPRAFSLIYDWMIEDIPRLPRLGLLEVFRAATFLQIPQLVKQCEYCLAHGFKEESAVMLYLEAQLLNMESQQRRFLSHVSKFFLSLVASQEFLKFPLEAILLLLGSSHVSVNSELEVFMAAVRWLNHQWPQRQSNIAKVTSCIRFALVPPWLLIRLQKPDICAEEVKRIASLPDVRQQIHDGIAYTTTRLFFGSDREAFKVHLQRTNSEPPMQRNWIYDRACDHHHRLNCKITLEFTYELFVAYLNYLQMQHRDYWQTLEPADASRECLSCQRATKNMKEEKNYDLS